MLQGVDRRGREVAQAAQSVVEPPRVLGQAQARRLRDAILAAVDTAPPEWLDPASIEAFRRR